MLNIRQLEVVVIKKKKLHLKMGTNIKTYTTYKTYTKNQVSFGFRFRFRSRLLWNWFYHSVNLDSFQPLKLMWVFKDEPRRPFMVLWYRSIVSFDWVIVSSISQMSIIPWNQPQMDGIPVDLQNIGIRDLITFSRCFVLIVGQIHKKTSGS